jgi:hypothetical protein
MSSASGNSGALQIADVSCNHCGAPLQLPTDTRFATCSYCGARLEVLHQGGAAYTRVLDDIDQRTRRIEAGVDELNQREQLEQLDREWSLSRDQFLVHEKNGNASLPSAGVAIFGSAFAAVFGVFWTIFALSIRAPIFFCLFGVLFVVMAIVAGITSTTKAAAYRQAESAYRRQRRELLAEIQKQKTG